MKKLILVMVVMAMVIPMAFADDAKVLPAGVLRTYIVPVYSFASQQYDKDGEAEDLSFNGLPIDKVTVFNIGGAIEYGVNDWISAALQWTPGYTLNTKFTFNEDVDTILFSPGAKDKLDENVTAKGPAELFVGAKFQIVGEKAPVMNDMFRVAAAAGMMLPLATGYDAKAEDNQDPVGAEETVNIGVSKNAMGIGARFYADYIINEMFFFNLYSQYKYLLPVSEEKTPLNYYNSSDKMYDFGYELTLEAEPHFAMMVADGVELSAGLPVTYVITPDITYDGDTVDDTATSSLYLKPSVSTFLQKLPLPMEFKVGYEMPLAGKNVFARNNVVFQIKSYMKF